MTERAPRGRRICVRWTIGDVSPFGFEALRLSVWGAFRLLGGGARYVVCVNSIPVGQARANAGEMPACIEWRDTSGEVPPFLSRHLDHAMAEGVGWKLAPLRVEPDRFELSLDNDCILWDMPAAIREWLDDADGHVIAEDVRACFGQFASMIGPEPRNSGIRGLSPEFDLESALRGVLANLPVALSSELDEQGMQVAALMRAGPPHVVRVSEVTISSPFPPHLPDVGSCGVHCVGLNAKQLPWSLDGRPAVEHIREHWRRLRPRIYERVGLSMPVVR